MKPESTFIPAGKETFPDGSYIETAPDGCRTVYGSMAHAEYFKRLKQEREEKVKREKEKY